LAWSTLAQVADRAGAVRLEGELAAQSQNRGGAAWPDELRALG